MFRKSVAKPSGQSDRPSASCRPGVAASTPVVPQTRTRCLSAAAQRICRGVKPCSAESKHDQSDADVSASGAAASTPVVPQTRARCISAASQRICRVSLTRSAESKPNQSDADVSASGADFPADEFACLDEDVTEQAAADGGSQEGASISEPE